MLTKTHLKCNVIDTKPTPSKSLQRFKCLGKRICKLLSRETTAQQKNVVLRLRGIKADTRAILHIKKQRSFPPESRYFSQGPKLRQIETYYILYCVALRHFLTTIYLPFCLHSKPLQTRRLYTEIRNYSRSLKLRSPPSCSKRARSTH